MVVVVSLDAGEMTVAGGVDFVVDWETGVEQPGLAILDKDESDNAAKNVAYFAPGCWKAVVKKP